MQIIKSVDDVIKRILALQITIDRGYEDKNIQDNIDVKKIKKVRGAILKWVKKENCLDWMSSHERELFMKELNTLTLDEMGEATWLIESLAPLLWSVGICNELQDFSKFTEDKYYPKLFFTEENPIEKIKNSLSIDNELKVTNIDVEKYYYAYLLIYWRCKIRLDGYKKKVIIPEVFKELKDFQNVIDLLPIYKSSDLVMVYQINFYELNKRETTIVYKLVYNRLRSLYWLLSDCYWENINENTFNEILKKYNLTL